MKHNFILTAFTLCLAWCLLSGFDPNNPPTGRTGAPGETTCQNSSCHGGGNYTGSVELTGLPDTVMPNEAYTLTITNTSNAVRAGFELTCLNDGVNTACGVFTAGTGVSIGTGTANRKYPRQSSPKTLSGGAASWNFGWTAPATGESMTFYFVSLCANADAEDTGDNVLIGTKTVTLYNPPSNSELPKVDQIICYYDGFNQLIINSNKPENQVRIFGSNGQQLLSKKINNQANIDVSSIPCGMYIASITSGNQTITRKFLKF